MALSRRMKCMVYGQDCDPVKILSNKGREVQYELGERMEGFGEPMGGPFSTVDEMTVASAALPQPEVPRYSPGIPTDTISMINPMPKPTNSTYTMGSSGPSMGIIDAPSMMGLSKPSDRRTIKSAEWNRPSYNYKRTKKAEESAINSNLGLVVGGALLLIGVPTVLKMLDESFDASGLNIGGNPTP